MTPEEAKSKKAKPFDSSQPKSEKEGHLAYGIKYEVRDRTGDLLGYLTYVGREDDFFIFHQEFEVKEFENSHPVSGKRYRRIVRAEIGEINDILPPLAPVKGGVYEVIL